MTRIARAPRIDFSDLRRELELPEGYPAAAVAEARAAPRELPRRDCTDIEFVTIDPAASQDLDQAMCLRKNGPGYRVSYAIADVAAFVTPGGALDFETWQRGQTVYLPDGKVPLHPTVMSEGRASLLPGQTCPVVLWTIDLDTDGATVNVRVERALARSRAKLDYDGVSAALATGTLPEPHRAAPHDREITGRASPRPGCDQFVGSGTGDRARRGRLAAEAAPAAADGGVQRADLPTHRCRGRGDDARRWDRSAPTMPPPDQHVIERLRTCARALDISWPAGATVGEVVAATSSGTPRGAAFLDAAAELMRGAGYTAFEGQTPAQPLHGGMAIAYAHVTAPLRRLADRYAAETCLALHAGTEVPDWVREALPKLPEVMARTDRRANAAERGAVDLVEAVLLADRVGEQFEAAVLDLNGREQAPGGRVALDEPAVIAHCEGNLPLGQRIQVTLVEADPKKRRVLFRA